MRKIQNESLSQLLMQLRFTPQRKRKKQLEAAERLLAIVDPAKEYPFEFICFRITEYRPKDKFEYPVIKGDELAEDLRVFISRLSNRIAAPVSGQDEKVYSIEQLAKKQGVSTKTIHRWRKRGLTARKFVFEDGKKRLGFLQSAIDEFFEQNAELIGKAKTFARLTDKQKQQIIKQAAELASKTMLSRYQIIEKIAAKFGKVHETVRYTILNYEKVNPDKPLFVRPSGVIAPATAVEVYKLYNDGAAIEELMEHFNRSKSSIYRIINRRRAKALLAKKIEFIDSEEFLNDDAETLILSKQYHYRPDTPTLLNRENEVQLFRRYNFLKYLASIIRAQIKLGRILSSNLKKVEQFLTEAETVKKIIIEANLGLVVSITNKHITDRADMMDLISEGNFSLMRAVEKFDYTRGVRFATYAAWAIAKDFARTIPAEAARPDKPTAASMKNLDRDLRTVEAAGVVAVEQARKSLIQIIKDNLDQREQYIIINHFGLEGTLIRKYKKTLKQIGEDLDITKERVRQIELVALQKLRHSLSDKQFDLLTK
ncbi:sigma-70 family RNA polymerase sigma factor [Planctomycetota bacterium]